MTSLIARIGMCVFLLGAAWLPASGAVTESQAQLARNVLGQIQVLERLDFYGQEATLEQRFRSEASIEKRLALLQQLIFLHQTADNFPRALAFSQEMKTLAASVRNTEMTAVADMYLIAATHGFDVASAEAELSAFVSGMALADTVRIRANYLLVRNYIERNKIQYASLQALSSVLIDLQNEPGLENEHGQILWQLANFELDFDRRFAAITDLFSFAETTSFPLHRFILLFNSVNYLLDYSDEPALAYAYAEVYLTLANASAQPGELFFAYERQAYVLSRMGKSTEAIEVYNKAREHAGGQSPFWQAQLNRLEAKHQVMVGNTARARELQAAALAFFNTTGTALPFAMHRTEAYIALAEGRTSEGIQYLERYWSDYARSLTAERNASLTIIRELADKEQRAHLLAADRLTSFQLASAGLGVLAFALAALGVLQYRTSTSLKTSRDEITRISRTDALTQLNNRGYWQECLEQEFGRLQRGSAARSCLIMFDIDHFKHVNDVHGHTAGDQAIVHLADMLRQHLRKTDIAGRYGGEEFAVLLLDCTVEDACIFAERVRSALDASSIKYDGTDIHFTISLGIAEFSQGLMTPTQWIEHADSALYAAKKAGRNRVMQYQAVG